SDLGRCATDPGHPVDEVVADGGGGLGRGDRRCLHRGSGRRPGRVRLVRWGRRLGLVGRFGRWLGRVMAALIVLRAPDGGVLDATEDGLPEQVVIGAGRLGVATGSYSVSPICEAVFGG